MKIMKHNIKITLTQCLSNIMLIALCFVFSYNSVGQTSCPSTSQNPWEWPSHRNWFFAPNVWTGMVRNMSTGVKQ